MRSPPAVGELAKKFGIRLDLLRNCEVSVMLVPRNRSTIAGHPDDYFDELEYLLRLKLRDAMAPTMAVFAGDQYNAVPRRKSNERQLDWATKDRFAEFFSPKQFEQPLISPRSTDWIFRLSAGIQTCSTECLDNFPDQLSVTTTKSKFRNPRSQDLSRLQRQKKDGCFHHHRPSRFLPGLESGVQLLLKIGPICYHSARR